MSIEMNIEHHEERPTRNLRTDPIDTIQAIALIEGPGWMKLQLDVQEGRANPANHSNSVQAALERLQAGERAVIYGAYGINRWMVHEDGSVSFSESHAGSQNATQKARDLGFDIIF